QRRRGPAGPGPRAPARAPRCGTAARPPAAPPGRGEARDAGRAAPATAPPRRGGRARRRSSPSAPGFGETCCPAALTPAAARAAPGHLPAGGLPSRPGAGRGAPPRRKCARPGPAAGRAAVPAPARPPRPAPAGGGPGDGGEAEAGIRRARAGRPQLAGLNPPGGLRGPHPFTSERFHALLNSLFKVLFNFPLRYLLAIGLVPVFSLRWSLPPALGCIPKQPDSEKPRARRAGGPLPASHRPRAAASITRTWVPRERRRGGGLLYATCPAPHRGAGIRRWALPSSLAVTEGILVSFFSSAD
ncbi:translation initiation factor IF-2-like, partial [Manacus candei]|uniref:translation initiation factor IF-2-like n=1 Tax=Manacus candei TaxID=415023 RepID=UPI00222708D0